MGAVAGTVEHAVTAMLMNRFWPNRRGGGGGGGGVTIALTGNSFRTKAIFLVRVFDPTECVLIRITF